MKYFAMIAMLFAPLAFAGGPLVDNSTSLDNAQSQGQHQGQMQGQSQSSSNRNHNNNTAVGVAYSIEFSAGTLSQPKLEEGVAVTNFRVAPFDKDLLACQRYFEKLFGALAGPYVTNATTYANWLYKARKRVDAIITGGGGGALTSTVDRARRQITTGTPSFADGSTADSEFTGL